MELAFFLIAFLSQIFGTLTGFGSSVLFVPISSMLFDLKTVLVLTSLMHIFSNASQLIIFRRELNWQLAIKIGIPSFVFVILGAVLCEKIDIGHLKLAMGVFLCGFSLISIKNENWKIDPSTPNAIIGGALSGLFTGLIGTGGAIRGAALTSFNLHRSNLIATSAGIDLVSDVGRAYIYMYNGYLKEENYWYLPVLLLVAITGSFTGKYLLKFISQKAFKRFMLVMIFLSGVIMIYGFYSLPVQKN